MHLQTYAGSRSLNARNTLPPSLFTSGQTVQVMLNERNQTSRAGIIRAIHWHRAQQKFYYHLLCDGKPCDKRYFDDDLIAV